MISKEAFDKAIEELEKVIGPVDIQEDNYGQLIMYMGLKEEKHGYVLFEPED